MFVHQRVGVVGDVLAGFGHHVEEEGLPVGLGGVAQVADRLELGAQVSHALVQHGGVHVVAEVGRAREGQHSLGADPRVGFGAEAPAPAAILELRGLQGGDIGADARRQPALQIGPVEFQGANGRLNRSVVEQPVAIGAGALQPGGAVGLDDIERFDDGRGQRRLEAHLHLALALIHALRQDDGLNAAAFLVQFAGGGHEVAAVVAVDGQQRVWANAHGGLAGVAEVAAFDTEGQVGRLHVINGDVPAHQLPAAGRDRDRLRCLAVNRHPGGFQRHRGLDVGVGVVVDVRAQRHLVADGEEARRDRADDERQAGQDIDAGLADAGVGGGRLAVQPPGGDVVRQGNLDRGAAIGVGHQPGFPVGRVAEVLTHVVLAFDAERRRHLIRPAAAAEAAGHERFLDLQPFAGDEQTGAKRAAQRLAEVERVEDVRRVVFLQQQHGQIDQSHRNLGLDAVAGLVGHGDVERGRIAGGVLLRAGRQRHGQVKLVGRDDDLHEADADVGIGEVGVGHIDRLDGHNGHVDVGRVLLGDGQRDDLAAVDGDDLLVDDVAALDHQPRLHGLGERRLDENLRRLAGAILALVGRHVHRALVGVGAPAGELGVHRPDGRAGHLLAAAGVGQRSHDEVCAARFGREAHCGLAVGVGGHGLAADFGVNRRPLRHALAELDDALAFPVALVEDDFNRLVAQGFAGPIFH